MENEGGRDTNYSQSPWNNPENLEKILWGLEIHRRIKTVQTTALLRSAGVL